MKQRIVIINNEKCIKIKNDIYCQNIEMKALPESLASFFDIQMLLRKSKIFPVHKIAIRNIILSSNIFSFIFGLFKFLNNVNTKYLIIAITPYTFFAYLLLYLTRKKIFLYLRSDGLDEYKLILGRKFVWVYKFMLFVLKVDL